MRYDTWRIERQAETERAGGLPSPRPAAGYAAGSAYRSRSEYQPRDSAREAGLRRTKKRRPMVVPRPGHRGM